MKHRSFGSRLFDGVNTILLLVMGLICFLPFLSVLAASLSSSDQLIKHSIVFFPVGFSLSTYKYVLFTDSTIGHSLLVSVFMTVIGTILNLTITSLMAYPLAHSHVVGHKVLMPLVVFTLVFSGGMIPTYLVVQRLGLLDTYASVLLPGVASAFNLVIFISFFRSIPGELEDAAKIDGCNDLMILVRIILPVSTPLLATFTLLFAVGQWNEWFSYVLYINDSAKWPVQVVLRTIMTSAAQVGNSLQMDQTNYVPPSDIVRDCVIMVATLPILVIYPFLQKYFTKGLMIGSVKG